LFNCLCWTGGTQDNKAKHTNCTVTASIASTSVSQEQLSILLDSYGDDDDDDACWPYQMSKLAFCVSSVLAVPSLQNH
jgi:hypothetical protein